MKVSCDNCGETFEKERKNVKNSERDFCSYDCYHDWRKGRNREMVVCENCGKEFKQFKSRAEANDNNFCCRNCYEEWREAHEHVKCDNCGEEIKQKKFQMDRNDHHYCSRECYFEHKHERGTLEVECEVCGTIFEKKRNRVEKHEHHFCTRECWYNWFVGDEISTEPYYGPKWEKVREKVLERDNYKCQKCDVSREELDRELDVHHIIPIKEFDSYEEANKLENLISLCLQCHRAVENNILPDDATDLQKVKVGIKK